MDLPSQEQTPLAKITSSDDATTPEDSNIPESSHTSTAYSYSASTLRQRSVPLKEKISSNPSFKKSIAAEHCKSQKSSSSHQGDEEEGGYFECNIW